MSHNSTLLKLLKYAIGTYITNKGLFTYDQLKMEGSRPPSPLLAKVRKKSETGLPPPPLSDFDVII